MRKTLFIELLVATMLLSWLPQQITLCLASMAECSSCCCACCPDKSNDRAKLPGQTSSDCCITLNVELIDQITPAKTDIGAKHDGTVLRELTAGSLENPLDQTRIAHQFAQAPPGLPLRLTLCSWLM